MNIIKKVVKYKRLQKLSSNLAVIMPKQWIDELGWSRTDELALEFLPYQNSIKITFHKHGKVILDDEIIENLPDEEISDIIAV